MRQWLQGKGATWCRPFVVLLLILAVCQGAARLTWRLGDVILPISSSLSNSSPGALESEGATGDYDAAPSLNHNLANLHLFGRAGKVTTAGRTSGSVLPPTTLNLSLVGVIYSSSPEKSVAVIQGDNVEEAVYGVGDELPGNAIVSKIHQKSVTLRRAGRYETLALDPSLPSPSQDVPSAVVQPAKHKARKSRRQRRSLASPPHPGGRVSVDRAYIKQHLANLDELAKEVRASAYMESGAQVGYQLKVAKGSQLLGQFGLEAGDVLTGVNGMPLRSTNDAIQVYAKAKETEKIEIEVLRGGQRLTREYFIK